MATLHLMVGLPCSGKTTYANELSIKENALLLTTDVWHIKLYGHDEDDLVLHNERHTCIERIIWGVAERVLEMGGNVILDFGFWSRIERDDFRYRARKLGVTFKMHYMDVPNIELYRRLEERNKNPQEGVFIIPKSYMDIFISVFDIPTDDELI